MVAPGPEARCQRRPATKAPWGTHALSFRFAIFRGVSSSSTPSRSSSSRPAQETACAQWAGHGLPAHEDAKHGANDVPRAPRRRRVRARPSSAPADRWLVDGCSTSWLIAAHLVAAGRWLLLRDGSCCSARLRAIQPRAGRFRCWRWLAGEGRLRRWCLPRAPFASPVAVLAHGRPAAAPPQQQEPGVLTSRAGGATTERCSAR